MSESFTVLEPQADGTPDIKTTSFGGGYVKGFYSSDTCTIGDPLGE